MELCAPMSDFAQPPLPASLDAAWTRQHIDGLSFGPAAQALLAAGRLEEARQLCETGVRAHPWYATGHFLLGRIYLAERRWTDARLELERTLQLEGTSPGLLDALADCHQALDQEELARECRQMIYDFDPDPQAAEPVPAEVESVRFHEQASEFQDRVWAAFAADTTPFGVRLLDEPEEAPLVPWYKYHLLAREPEEEENTMRNKRDPGGDELRDKPRQEPGPEIEAGSEPEPASPEEALRELEALLGGAGPSLSGDEPDRAQEVEEATGQTEETEFEPEEPLEAKAAEAEFEPEEPLEALAAEAEFEPEEPLEAVAEEPVPEPEDSPDVPPAGPAGEDKSDLWRKILEQAEEVESIESEEQVLEKLQAMMAEEGESAEADPVEGLELSQPGVGVPDRPREEETPSSPESPGPIDTPMEQVPAPEPVEEQQDVVFDPPMEQVPAQEPVEDRDASGPGGESEMDRDAYGSLEDLLAELESTDTAKPGDSEQGPEQPPEPESEPEALELDMPLQATSASEQREPNLDALELDSPMQATNASGQHETDPDELESLLAELEPDQERSPAPDPQASTEETASPPPAPARGGIDSTEEMIRGAIRAEIMAAQGKTEDAIALFESLLVWDPQRTLFKERLEQLRRQAD
jgi:tetratricopeptide (TPR) repeat protein